MKAQIRSSFFCLILIFYSCAETNDKIDIEYIKSESKIVFIEANSEEGIFGEGFGDLVIFDLEKNKKTKITSDSYFDEYPLWLNKNKIIFSSSRFPNYIIRKEIGLIKSLYVYDLQKNKYSYLNYGLLKKMNIFNFFGLTYNENKEIHFAYENSIFKLDLMDSSFISYSIDSIKGDIEDFKTSPNNQNTILKTSNLNESKSGFDYSLYLLDSQSNNIKKIILPISKNLEIGYWFDNNEFCISQDKIYRYNIVSNMLSEINIPGLNEDFIVSNINKLDDTKMIMFSIKSKFNEFYKMTTYDGNYGIATYDIENNEFKILYEDSLEKDYMDVYLE